ncbi:MAG: hypothetical protein QGG42_05610 [Phycisphaerae bacterium]|jgi:hypothetical protein|nr:hypothetical protein [Phycisphaerae bacterium]
MTQTPNSSDSTPCPTDESRSNRTYILFENAGTADFFALFFVGFTDKAGDDRTMGMFGSGFKLGIVAALRQGLDVLMYIGRKKVTFRTIARNVKGQEVKQVVFVCEYPDGTEEEHNTNLTLGYGAKDWRNPWCVYRELLQNCHDADPHGYNIVAGVAPQGREGFTRVFLKATPEVMDIYRNMEMYFREERQAYFSCEQGRLYPKSSPEGWTWYYCKGMYVLRTHDHGMFDYDLFHMPINESRDASTDNLYAHVLQLLDETRIETKIEVLRFVTDNYDKGVSTLEGSLLWTATRHGFRWAQAFREAFPDHVICSFSAVEYESMVRMGRKTVRLNRELYRLLASHRIKTAEQVLRDEEESSREGFEPEGTLKDNFNTAFKRIADKLPEVNRLNIEFVRLPRSERNVSFITRSRGRGAYQFSESLLRSGPKAISKALIDSLAQTRSVSGRCDLDFENELLGMVLECID